jgi:hypothetical protein
VDCRICVLREAHVHVSDVRLELAHVPPDDFAFRPSQITGIDFALPAVKQAGTWWLCTQELVAMVWPRWKKKIAGRRRRVTEETDLGFGPPENQNEADEEDR